MCNEEAEDDCHLFLHCSVARDILEHILEPVSSFLGNAIAIHHEECIHLLGILGSRRIHQKDLANGSFSHLMVEHCFNFFIFPQGCVWLIFFSRNKKSNVDSVDLF